MKGYILHLFVALVKHNLILQIRLSNFLLSNQAVLDSSFFLRTHKHHPRHPFLIPSATFKSWHNVPGQLCTRVDCVRGEYVTITGKPNEPKGVWKGLGTLQSSTLTDNVTLPDPPWPDTIATRACLFFSFSLSLFLSLSLQRVQRVHGHVEMKFLGQDGHTSSHRHFLARFTIISLSDVIGWVPWPLSPSLSSVSTPPPLVRGCAHERNETRGESLRGV